MRDDGIGDDTETRADAWARFWRDLRHPFTRHPESRGRYGWQDLLGLHASVNIATEWAKERPQEFGHVAHHSGLVLILLLVAAGATIGWIMA